ncbi:MAG: ABC transporter ATP-binding protein [Thermomicrobium sp.]|nr:ABC transporter ATP-binding protein [Thermomicrobium sp.]MDW8007818.1 ABC transporter ATP-binding protein [Thermomicrobium sp.]
MPDAERATVEGHEAAVIADSVSRIFGPLRAVDRLSVVIPRGVIYGLLGPSGSGKTTFLRMVVGALRPSEGRLWVFGTAMPSRRVAQRIGYMPQAPALYPDLTLRENLRFFGAVYRVPRRQLEQRIEELATDLDLLAWLDHPLYRFSGGMVQRASLAVALLHEPDLLVLDEPTVGLDPLLRRILWERFRALASRGTTLLISTHSMDEADRCDLLGFLRGGRLLASDTPAALRALTGQDSLEDAFLVLAGYPVLPVEPSR